MAPSGYCICVSVLKYCGAMSARIYGVFWVPLYIMHIWGRGPAPPLHLDTWARLHTQAFPAGPGMAPMFKLTPLEIFGRDKGAHRRRVRALYQVCRT